MCVLHSLEGHGTNMKIADAKQFNLFFLPDNGYVLEPKSEV